MSEQPDGGTGWIVAGVDGSESSKLALRWALRQAALTGSRVDAVTAWHIPVTYGWAPLPEEDWDLEGAARKMLTDVLAEVAGPAGEGPEVRARVVEGNAASVLINASKGADLLVLGNRGYGGFTEALLGSVSQHAVQQATCPVVIVR
jgi:nucleotide-binding universal stress UspA family protein